MRVLIIGGTGFIGSQVAMAVHDGGHDVGILHRGKTENERLPFSIEYIEGDRNEIERAASDIGYFKADVVIDMIAYNEASTRRVLDVLKDKTARYVVASSVDVYLAYGRLHRKEPGEPVPQPMSEDAPLREQFYPFRGWNIGMDDYDKILVERAAATVPELQATVLRLPMVYGERDPQLRLLAALKRMDDGRRTILLPQGLAGWRAALGYVDNVALAVALAATHARAAGRTYNVADEPVLTQAEWTRAIGDAAGWDGEILTVPDDAVPEHLIPPGDPSQDFVADTRRIREELGFKERYDLAESLERTVRWYRHVPPKADPAQFDYAAEDAALRALGQA